MTFACRAWICVYTCASPTPPLDKGRELVSCPGNNTAPGPAVGKKHAVKLCLLRHFQFGPEYTVVSEYGGDASGDIAAAIPTWCRSDVCIAELRTPVSDAKLARLPSAFTCFGQQISVSVQPSILAKAHFNQSINLHFLSLGLIRGVNRQ